MAKNKKKEFKGICNEIFCTKNIVTAAVVITVLVLFTYAYASITNITHIYEHELGECHLDAECNVGQICFRECPEFDENGLCLNQVEIGFCTKTCNTGMDCESGKCEPRVLWNSNAGQELNICLQ